jgi:hypothetical protein
LHKSGLYVTLLRFALVRESLMARFFHEDLGPSWVLSLYLAVAVE